VAVVVLYPSDVPNHALLILVYDIINPKTFYLLGNWIQTTVKTTEIKSTVSAVIYANAVLMCNNIRAKVGTRGALVVDSFKPTKMSTKILFAATTPIDCGDCTSSKAVVMRSSILHFHPAARTWSRYHCR
jgi:hypothetical protein